MSSPRLEPVLANLAAIEGLINDSSGDPQKRIHRLEKAVRLQQSVLVALVRELV